MREDRINGPPPCVAFFPEIENAREREKEKGLRAMEETMMAMLATHRNPRNPTTPLPSWKLYDNPFYSSHHPHPHLSARKLAASLWDLAFVHLHPSMEPDAPPSRARLLAARSDDLDLARSIIKDLKAEVEFERRQRRKTESLNKKLARELGEARKAKEEMAEEARAAKTEMERARKEMEAERKMLRLAEIWREERIQMKLAEARLVMEEKIAELSKCRESEETHFLKKENPPTTAPEKEKMEKPRVRNAELKSENSNPSHFCNSNNNNNVQSTSQRRTSPEAENPHIKRGIKGSVEFPRVVRAVGLRGRQMGSKVECQKAQLKLLLRHRIPAGGALSLAGAKSVAVV